MSSIKHVFEAQKNVLKTLRTEYRYTNEYFTNCDLFMTRSLERFYNVEILTYICTCTEIIICTIYTEIKLMYI